MLEVFQKPPEDINIQQGEDLRTPLPNSDGEITFLNSEIEYIITRPYDGAVDNDAEIPGKIDNTEAADIFHDIERYWLNAK